MCILFIYTDPSPPAGGYRLIIASNRDEFYKRPARKAFLCPKTNIIGGRDMEPGREGGMWLGLSIRPPAIKFGALLNVTGEEKRAATSGRGPLVYNYLKSAESAPQYLGGLKSRNSYSAFNLFALEVTPDESHGYHHSNSPEATLEYHGRQILAFGNSTPDAPFTKVRKGRDRFERIVGEARDKTDLIERLLQLLKWEESHLPDPELARRAPAGADFLSSVYVKMEKAGYGTRTHSIVLVDAACNVEFVEHTMKEPIDGTNPQWEVTVLKASL
ncbi:NRDE domain containing protein [Asbolus verrucosus]|uniref:NRDE domain containing protein n=1 Tax=Asbolus verrucosus TaxID=1661398 RepID=A0A482WBK6_ASBVE|nr:NRDE domain containing protein [Asbolus verrucosus]